MNRLHWGEDFQRSDPKQRFDERAYVDNVKRYGPSKS